MYTSLLLLVKSSHVSLIARTSIELSASKILSSSMCAERLCTFRQAILKPQFKCTKKKMNRFANLAADRMRSSNGLFRYLGLQQPHTAKQVNEK